MAQEKEAAERSASLLRLSGESNWQGPPPPLPMTHWVELIGPDGKVVKRWQSRFEGDLPHMELKLRRIDDHG